MTNDATIEARQALRHALDELDVTGRAVREINTEALANFDEIRLSIAETIAMGRDLLQQALDDVDAALVNLSAARLAEERNPLECPSWSTTTPP
jgi:hypothetical protein